MSRALKLALMLICLALSGAAAEPLRIAPRPLASAFDAMQAGRWEVAADLAARDGRAASALIEWYRLRAGRGTAGDVMAFLRQNPDWPGLDYLRKQNEFRMLVAPQADILEFYKDHAPQTGIGALSYASALIATGQQGDAEAGLVMAWRSLDLTTAEHDAFIAAHAPLLAPHHEARLDMALWRGLKDVKQMLPLVSDKRRLRAHARQVIEKGIPKLDEWLAKLPRATRNDPHVAHALFNHLIKNDETDAAIKLILRQSRSKEGLGDAARWAGWRRAMARSQMRDGNHQIAYDLASVHQLSEGSAFADLEWLSGYLALTFLNQPDLALVHFQEFNGAVASPISKGRAGYWLGRAYDALGNFEAAQEAYAQGAKHQTSFYGLLAAERAGLPPDPALSGQEESAPWREEADFAHSTVHQAAVLALASGRVTLAEQFFVHLSRSQGRDGLAQMAQMLEDLDQPHLQVMLGKAAARRGIVIHRAYYPLHPMIKETLKTPMELALTIARRESEFDTSVVSGAGAQGLMQLMPGTAKDVARDLGLTYSRQRVMQDWRYNTHLGATYLAQLGRRFDGNVVMVAAGYNAGPGRPIRWMQGLGDPRTGEVDVVDWIEHIPFRETRNYVMRVAESLPVYRARLDKEPLPIPFSQELTGSTVRPILLPTE